MGYLQSRVPGGHLEASCSWAQPRSPCLVWASHPGAADIFHSKVLCSSTSQGPIYFLPESFQGFVWCYQLDCIWKREKMGHFTGATEKRREKEARRRKEGIVSGH